MAGTRVTLSDEEIEMILGWSMSETLRAGDAVANLEVFQEAHPDHWDDLDEDAFQEAVTRRAKADALFTRIEGARRVQRTRAIRKANQTGGKR